LSGSMLDSRSVGARRQTCDPIDATFPHTPLSVSLCLSLCLSLPLSVSLCLSLSLSHSL
jgi:hypothetical protein